MHFVNAVLISGTCLLSLASAGCFTSGTSWDDKIRAAGELDGVCAVLAGQYSGGQQKSECRNGTGGTRYNFRIQKISDGTLSISKDDCVQNLGKEITGCDQGGKSAFTDFEFTSDPEDGAC